MAGEAVTAMIVADDGGDPYTIVNRLSPGFFYAYDCKGVGTRPRTGSGVLMERSGAEESRWHEVDVKPRSIQQADQRVQSEHCPSPRSTPVEKPA